MKATIKKIIHETPRVVTFIVTPEEPVTFTTGQAMRWSLPGVPGGRLFSVASQGGKNITELYFTIRIFDDGRFTPHLKTLQEGSEITLAGPYGAFTFSHDDPRDVGLIAGGSGISVMRSIMLDILASNSKRKVHLVFSVLNPDEIIYKEELAVLRATHSNFTYTIVATEADASWTGPKGFVTEAIMDKEFLDYAEQFYLCGPKGFMDCVTAILKNRNVPADRIHIDQWTFYAPKLMT